MIVPGLEISSYLLKFRLSPMAWPTSTTLLHILGHHRLLASKSQIVQVAQRQFGLQGLQQWLNCVAKQQRPRRIPLLWAFFKL